MKSVEIALKAGRLRQSPVTGFVHHCYENIDRRAETIPIYENFCFALALFRTKIAENVLEGKSLLEKLFAFKTLEGFPIYLHDYPHCKSRSLQQKLSIVAKFLLRDFSAVLGDGLRGKLEEISLPIEKTEEWADFLIRSQLTGEDPTPGLQGWDSQALCFVGPQKQERGEPQVTLYDLIMGEWTGMYSKRATVDQPVHIQASLIYPKAVTASEVAKKWSRLFWGENGRTHSALLDAKGNILEEGDTLIIDLPEKEVHDEIEISYFIDRFPGAQFSVAGLKSTTFQLGETLRVQSAGKSFGLTFSLVSGEGRFWGHLHLGNRPGQIGCKDADKHEAFDWKIALRTIERTKPCQIEMKFVL
jgi:hypothetical protein